MSTANDLRHFVGGILGNLGANSIEQLEAENARLRAALEELLAVDPDGFKHLLCTDWIDKITEALK